MSVVLENEKIRVTIAELGAELTSIRDKKSQIEFLWQADKTYWGRHAPILFPFVGRSKDDQYRYENQTYHMGQHGFARDNLFTVIEQNQTAARLQFVSTNETKKNYPFDFNLILSYELVDNAVKVGYEVTNPGEKELIFGIGGHPAFNVPFEPGQDGFTDYAFTFNPEATRTQLPLVGPFIDVAHKKQVETRGRLPITHELFENDALVFETPGVTAVSIVSQKNDHSVTLEMDHMPFIGLWSPYPKDAPFVCLEPWCAHADTTEASGELTEKASMTHLLPTEQFQASYKIAVK